MEDNTAIMAQEPVMARPMTSYADVMTYLHSLHIPREELGMVGNRLVVEYFQESLESLLAFGASVNAPGQLGRAGGLRNNTIGYQKRKGCALCF